MDSLILELSSVCNELWKIFSYLVFLKAFMEHRCILLHVKIVSVSVFTDLSQSGKFAMWDEKSY